MKKVINYVKGDVTEPHIDHSIPGVHYIAHVCTNFGGYGKGCAQAIAKRFPNVRDHYKQVYRSNQNTLNLGDIQIVQAIPYNNLFVVNMIAQNGYKTYDNPMPLSYEYLRLCLSNLRMNAYKRTIAVHMPKIGTGLAGGNWGVISTIISTTLVDHGIPVNVYTL